MSCKHCLSLVFRLTPCPPFRHQYHQLVPYTDSAELHYICPAHRWCKHCVSAARCWRLPSLMTLLLLYPALSKHSVRRGETLNFCNGLKWSKYHSPPCICPSFKPRYHLLPNFLVHWQRQRAFPWRGNPCGFSCFSQLGTLFISQQLSWVIPHILPQNSREGPFS